MNIYQALKQDHKLVKSLLKKLEETTERSKKERISLLEKLKEILIPHARAEEKILYEPLKRSDVKEADDLAFEGYEEHGVVDHLFAELDKTEPDDKRWGALMAVMKESLEHHIKEEEKKIFKKGHKSFEKETAELMTEKFETLKVKYLKELQSGKKLKQPPSHSLVG